MIAETIHWITDGSHPDDETTVLVQSGRDVGEGFHVEGEWYWASASRVQTQVTAWAAMPHGVDVAKRGSRRGRKP